MEFITNVFVFIVTLLFTFPLLAVIALFALLWVVHECSSGQRFLRGQRQARIKAWSDEKDRNEAAAVAYAKARAEEPWNYS